MPDFEPGMASISQSDRILSRALEAARQSIAACDSGRPDVIAAIQGANNAAANPNNPREIIAASRWADQVLTHHLLLEQACVRAQLWLLLMLAAQNHHQRLIDRVQADLRADQTNVADIRVSLAAARRNARWPPIPQRPDGRQKILEHRHPEPDWPRAAMFLPNPGIEVAGEQWDGAWMLGGGAMGTTRLFVRFDQAGRVDRRVVRKDVWLDREYGQLSDDLAPKDDGWQQIVHRDLKPSNIFLAPPTQDYRDEYVTPKIGDFGLAIKTSAADTSFNPKMFVDGWGTAGFMAPERKKNIDLPTHLELDDFQLLAHTNVFEIGIIMYCLIALVDRPEEKEWNGTDQEMLHVRARAFGNYSDV
jgi:hypothetical protein